MQESEKLIGYEDLAEFLNVSLVTARVYVMRYDIQPDGTMPVTNRFNRSITKFWWFKHRWQSYVHTTREYKGYKYLKKHFSRDGKRPACDARVLQYGNWDMTNDWVKVDCRMCLKMGNTLVKIEVANELRL